MVTRTYALLESMDADAPVYQQTADGQRSQIKKIPLHRPTLRQVFQDENGVGKVIRYKASSKTIFQDEQIEKEKIDANARFTTNERRALEFKHGFLVTNNELVQKYLETHPEFEGFKGFCDDVKQPRYKILDAVADAKVKNSEMRKRVKAASKVVDLELKEAQEMLILLNGSFFATPNELEECQNLLMDYVDDADEKGLDRILQSASDNTTDENTTVLIGKLINAELLSFDAEEGKVSRKLKNGKWKAVRELSTEYPIEERQLLFSNFLNTEDGKPLKEDLTKALSDAETK